MIIEVTRICSTVWISLKNVQSNNEGGKKVQSKIGKRVLRKITTELKKELVEKQEHGILVTDLVSGYKLGKLRMLTVLKKKDSTKGDDVSK